jgi:signal transduction histidine kinase
MDQDLIWMPVFMLLVYLFLSIRSMMMYKEFEHQLVIAKIEHNHQINQQRHEIARDLHDSLGAQLTLIGAVTDNLMHDIEFAPDRAKRQIDTLSDLSIQSVAELKSALWVLDKPELSLQDLLSQIKNFLKTIEEVQDNFVVHLTAENVTNSTIHSKQAAHLFRIVQEFVNNTLKHAQTKNVRIELACDDAWIHLSMHDEGIGFNPDHIQTNKWGIANLKKRVASLNGHCEINSNIGQGTSWLIHIPVSK